MIALYFNPPLKTSADWDKLYDALMVYNRNISWSNKSQLRSFYPSTEYNSIEYFFVGYDSDRPESCVYSSSKLDEFRNISFTDGWQWVENYLTDFDRTSDLFNQLNESNETFDSLMINQKCILTSCERGDETRLDHFIGHEVEIIHIDNIEDCLERYEEDGDDTNECYTNILIKIPNYRNGHNGGGIGYEGCTRDCWWVSQEYLNCVNYNETSNLFNSLNESEEKYNLKDIKDFYNNKTIFYEIRPGSGLPFPCHDGEENDVNRCRNGNIIFHINKSQERGFNGQYAICWHEPRKRGKIGCYDGLEELTKQLNRGRIIPADIYDKTLDTHGLFDSLNEYGNINNLKFNKGYILNFSKTPTPEERELILTKIVEEFPGITWSSGQRIFKIEGGTSHLRRDYPFEVLFIDTKNKLSWCDVDCIEEVLREEPNDWEMYNGWDFIIGESDKLFDQLNEAERKKKNYYRPEVGDILYCHSPVVMDYGKKETTKGKSYEVTGYRDYNDKLLTIVNDSEGVHGFSIDPSDKKAYFGRWFTLVKKDEVINTEDLFNQLNESNNTFKYNYGVEDLDYFYKNKSKIYEISPGGEPFVGRKSAEKELTQTEEGTNRIVYHIGLVDDFYKLCWVEKKKGIHCSKVLTMGGLLKKFNEGRFIPADIYNQKFNTEDAFDSLNEWEYLKSKRYTQKFDVGDRVVMNGTVGGKSIINELGTVLKYKLTGGGTGHPHRVYLILFDNWNDTKGNFLMSSAQADQNREFIDTRCSEGSCWYTTSDNLEPAPSTDQLFESEDDLGWAEDLVTNFPILPKYDGKTNYVIFFVNSITSDEFKQLQEELINLGWNNVGKGGISSEIARYSKLGDKPYIRVTARGSFGWGQEESEFEENNDTSRYVVIEL